MRGLIFFLIFLSSLPLIFVSPFNGILIWYAFSLGNFHTLIWGPLSSLNYAYIIAVLTCTSWLFSRTEKVHLPVTPLVVMTVIFALWVTFTSCFALAPADDVWRKWLIFEKILFMCLVGYALTTTRERVDQLIWVVVLSIGFWGAKGAILGSLHGFGTIHGPDGGMLADNNDLGLGLIMVLPLIFYHWHLAANRHVRRGLMIFGFLVTVGVLLTYSRGALLGVCAMGAVFWLRSRAKFATALLIAVIAVSVFTFAPREWTQRMESIQNYQDDGSAMGRINMWKVAMRIVELHPLTGGGFRVTFWPVVTNDMLRGTDLPRLTKPRAEHSIYFDVLSEHGWIGAILFVVIGAYSFSNCMWLVRQSRNRPDLAWANLLGRMGQAVLVGYATAGTFLSQAYLDEYWCIIFIFDAARRLAAKEIEASAVVTVPWVRPLVHQQAMSRGMLARSGERLGPQQGTEPGPVR
jgi:probable O-glycosylation ligase (exosortase A-associated)